MTDYNIRNNIPKQEIFMINTEIKADNIYEIIANWNKYQKTDLMKVLLFQYSAILIKLVLNLLLTKVLL
jgi:hypothetical protein